MPKINDDTARIMQELYGPVRGRGTRPGPGQVTLHQLAAQFGVSVPTVRKALRRELPPKLEDWTVIRLTDEEAAEADWEWDGGA